MSLHALFLLLPLLPTPTLPTSQGFEPWTAHRLVIQAQVFSPPSPPSPRPTGATQGDQPEPGAASPDRDGGLQMGQLSGTLGAGRVSVASLEHKPHP